MAGAEGPRLKTGVPSSGRGWRHAGGRRALQPGSWTARQLRDPNRV